MYYISYFKSKKGKVHDLLNAIFEASKRGVEVEVVLDRGFEFGRSGDISKKNIRSFSHLKRNGIKVFYDDLDTLSHSKYLIIDEEIIIVGSFNWSESSLTRNREAAVLIKSSEIVKEYLKLFNDIPRFLPKPVKEAILIPREFIRDKNLAAKMVVNTNYRALDLYLWLQKLSFERQSSSIELSKEDILKNIYKGAKVTFRRDSVIQDVMNRYLNLYKKKYNFIKSYERDKKQGILTIELFKTNKIEFDSLYLSKLYWDDGWDDRLMNVSKFCLLYILDKTESGRMGRYFTQFRMDAVDKYGVGVNVFTNGTKELSRYNLIEKDINFKVGESNPNGYILNKFYVYFDFQNILKKLENKTDKDLFKIVSRIADLVNEPCDLDVYKQLISLGNKYGLNVLKDSLTEVEKHGSGISPYRRFGYVVGMIKNKGQGL